MQRRGMFGSNRSFLVATLLLGCSAVWFRPGPTVLIGGDAGCYARIAKELSERAASSWLELSLGGQPFFEHPPLSFWVSGVVVTALGATPQVMVGLARLYASLTLLVLALVSLSLARGERRYHLAGFTVLGALTLPGFLYESQVAMLEAPLGLALACGLWAIARLTERASARAAIGFVAAVVAGFWVKGPPAFVLIGVLALAVALRWVPWRVGLPTAFGAVGSVVMSALAFDALLASRQLTPFFGTYLAKQVFPSMLEGRHQPDSNPFFYVGPVLRWYGPAVAALAVGLFARRRLLEPRGFVMGAALWLGVIVGFSLPVQKYQWYVHPGLVGAALVVGGVLSLVPERLVSRLAVITASAALLWPLVRFVPWDERLSETQRQTVALQTATGPRRADTIADCSPMDPWVSGHLMGFLFDARRVDCDAAAAWTFDGRTLRPGP